jgi:plasmid stability protein
MPNFTLKNIPDDLFSRLRAAAARHHRSINGEILACLEDTLFDRPDATAVLARARKLRNRVAGAPLTLDEVETSKQQGRA